MLSGLVIIVVLMAAVVPVAWVGSARNKKAAWNGTLEEKHIGTVSDSEGDHERDKCMLKGHTHRRGGSP